MMVLRFREVALFFRDLGALGELLGAFLGLGFGAIALSGLLPVLDLLLHRGLGGIVGCGAEAELGLFGLGLHAFAQRLRQRQAQRDDRDQQRDIAVLVRGFLGLVSLLHALMCAHDILPA